MRPPSRQARLLPFTATLAGVYALLLHADSAASFCHHGRRRVPPRAVTTPRFVVAGDGAGDEVETSICLQPLASAGLSSDELDVALSAISTACDQEGMPFDINQSNFQSVVEPAIPDSLPGASGRVIILTSMENEEMLMMDEDDEWLLPTKYSIANEMDRELFAVPDNRFDQPLLVHLCPYHQSLDVASAEAALAIMRSVVEDEAKEYDLCDPFACKTRKTSTSSTQYVPSAHFELDGAMVQANMMDQDQTTWDTSSVLVFDDLVDEHLRRGLMNVVKGTSEENNDDEWDDIENGPDPHRWVRGGLIDVPDDSTEDIEITKPCWGLNDDAIVDLCYNQHEAIQDFECRLAELFPQFHVCRLPEAVLGATVSPLTANAPTYGDTFSYHIDADPLQAPPSPWTDVFGRYPNRAAGKPRFMSCLVYLNDQWDDTFGAPTRFLDPPTQETFDVKPKPGRVCIMDQDCSHTVTPPKKAAGGRPRYSLVWKLILHPKEPGQDMTKLSAYDHPTTFIGSAKSTAS